MFSICNTVTRTPHICKMNRCAWREGGYPRFLSGRGLFAALLTRGVTTDALNSEPPCESRSFFSFSSFDSSSILFAALAALLGRFFGVAI